MGTQTKQLPSGNEKGGIIERYKVALDATTSARKECLELGFRLIAAEARLDACKFNLKVVALELSERPHA